MRPLQASKGIIDPPAAVMSFRSYATCEYIKSVVYAHGPDLTETVF